MVVNLQTDTTLYQKIDDLNQQALDARVVDAAKVYNVSKQALELSESIGYTKGKADALRSIGFSNIRFGKYDEAQQYLDQAYQLYQELNDLAGQSDVLEYFGIIQRSHSDYGGSLEFLYRSLELRETIDYQEGLSLSHYHLGVTYKYLGNFNKALEHLLQALSIAREINYWVSESYSLNLIGQIYFETGEYTDALKYYEESLRIREHENDKQGAAGSLDNIGFIHFKTGEYEKAINCCTEALSISKSIGDQRGKGNTLLHLADVYHKLGDAEKALDCCKQSLQIRYELGDKKAESEALLLQASIYFEKDDDSTYENVIRSLDAALRLAKESKALDVIVKAHYALYEAYKKFGQTVEALDHLENYVNAEKQLDTDVVKQKIINLEIQHKAEQSRKEAEIYRQKNIELEELYAELKTQKDELETQKKIVEASLKEVKEAQAQLIQREKMASLGELTAGIAHEIQNPLNFVNNFSEVSVELADDLENEAKTGNQQESIAIAKSIRENLEKVVHHGKRADAIVKAMLQHSRASTGKKEPTDINALADEYLRLSYHGFRAKNKSFTATTRTEFDETIGRISVIPQDIGRVLLNLYNNAFYSVTEKNKVLNGTRMPDGQGYEPVVSVSTKRLGDEIEITVCDNGIGIPERVLDKIFNPFFTTKPSGFGTGLGLSISYDIIKAHGGEMKVNSKEGEGATFIIQLPS